MFHFNSWRSRFLSVQKILFELFQNCSHIAQLDTIPICVEVYEKSRTSVKWSLSITNKFWATSQTKIVCHLLIRLFQQIHLMIFVLLWRRENLYELLMLIPGSELTIIEQILVHCFYVQLLFYNFCYRNPSVINQSMASLMLGQFDHFIEYELPEELRHLAHLQWVQPCFNHSCLLEFRRNILHRESCDNLNDSKSFANESAHKQALSLQYFSKIVLETFYSFLNFECNFFSNQLQINIKQSWYEVWYKCNRLNITNCESEELELHRMHI